MLAGCIPSEGAFIGGLDGVSDASTFEGVGVRSLAGQGVYGWSSVSGSAQIFDVGGDAGIIGGTAYGDYKVRYTPSAPVWFLPNTRYSLTFYIGYAADWPGGESGYSFTIGSITDGTYSVLASRSGQSSYRGNMHGSSTAVEPVTLEFSSGVIPPGGTMAIEWAQAGTSNVPGTSDYFGFNLVKLSATSVSHVPEPTVVTVPMSVFGVLVLLRRRRPQLEIIGAGIHAVTDRKSARVVLEYMSGTSAGAARALIQWGFRRHG